MRFLLDTDHITIIQRSTGLEFANIVAHMRAHGDRNVAYSIVSFHEQMIGAHAKINRSVEPMDVIRSYDRLGGYLKDYTRVTVLPFDAPAAARYSTLSAVRPRSPRWTCGSPRSHYVGA